MTAHPCATTLAQRVNRLVGRYTALSAERRTQARDHQAEASYFFGAAAAFEVVATELWEALGKHGVVPRVARVPHLSVLAECPADGLSADDDPCPAERAEAEAPASTGDEGTT